MSEAEEWTGFTTAERKSLEQAVARECACEFTDSVLVKQCSIHSLLSEPTSLRHLLFIRRMRGVLLRGEHVVDA